MPALVVLGCIWLHPVLLVWELGLTCVIKLDRSPTASLDKHKGKLPEFVTGCT